MASDLNDLIDVPRETLEIELKEWLDLSEPVVRANIARHLAALANHGGAHLDPLIGEDHLSVLDPGLRKDQSEQAIWPRKLRDSVAVAPRKASGLMT